MTSEHIGARLRAARLQRGLSLRSLATALGVSASLVSQVETGKTQPSVSTLYAIVTHLGISIDDLLGVATANETSTPMPDPTMAVVQSAADHDVLEMENGVRWERLAAGSGPADALLVTYQPGASSSVEGRLMRHAGIEYAYLIEGELTLQLEFNRYTLRVGDSLQFDSVIPHLDSNESSSIARGVWFIAGRRQQNLTTPKPSGRSAESISPASALDVLRMIDNLT